MDQEPGSHAAFSEHRPAHCRCADTGGEVEGRGCHAEHPDTFRDIAELQLATKRTCVHAVSADATAEMESAGTSLAPVVAWPHVG